MASTTKQVSGSIVPIENRTTYRGQVTHSSIDNRVSNRAVASAVFQRPRPLVLNDTLMIIECLDENIGVYENNATFKRIGTQTHVNHSYVLRTEEMLSNSGAYEQNRALAKIAEFTFGETLAESGQTVGYLRKRLGDLYRIGLALKRGDVRALQRMLNEAIPRDAEKNLRKWDATKRLANGHLELAFGIMPIVNDIEAAAKAYSEGLRTRGAVVKSRSGSLRTRKSSVGLTEFTPNRARFSYRGRVVNERVAQLNQLGLLNFPLQVWNKLPYSFVFDWFIPVSTYLGAVTGTAGLATHSACLTTERRRYQYQDLPSGRTVNKFSNTITRKPVSIPLPSLAGLSRESSLRFGQLATLAALFRQRLD